MNSNSKPSKGNKQRFYITFPSKDVERCDSYAVICANSQDEARTAAHEKYPKQWAFIYTYTEFQGQAEKYGLKMLEMFDAGITYNS